MATGLACLVLLGLCLAGCWANVKSWFGGRPAAAVAPANPAAQPGPSGAGAASTPLPAAPAGVSAATVTVLAPAPAAVAAPDLLHGIGIMGDSFYDEYQGTDNRGGEYHNVTFNLVELLVRLRGFNLGPWGDWGEPRRGGYKYNWARSGATSTTMIEMGQHTGLAEQVKAGEVTFVVIGIGGNDFNPYYLNGFKDVYDGAMSDAGVRAKVQDAIANVTLAVDTVQNAGAKGSAVVLFTHWEQNPLVVKGFTNAAGRKRVGDAIDAINAGLRQMAAQRSHVAIVDQNNYVADALPRMDAAGFLHVGDQKIDLLHNGDDPHFSFLGDNQHLGTVASGFAANFFFIDTLNRDFGQNIPLLSDDEILQAAGLK